jgi:hypothetical protein
VGGGGGGGGRGARGGSGTDDEDDEEDEHVDLRRVDAARGMIGGVRGGVNGDGRVDGFDGHAHMGVGGGAGVRGGGGDTGKTSPGVDGRGRGSPTERGNRRGREGEHTWTRDAMHEQTVRETAREAYEAEGAAAVAVAAAAAAAAAKRRKRGKASCCSWLRGEMCLYIYDHTRVPTTNAVQPCHIQFFQGSETVANCSETVANCFVKGNPCNTGNQCYIRRTEAQLDTP